MDTFRQLRKSFGQRSISSARTCVKIETTRRLRLKPRVREERRGVVLDDTNLALVSRKQF
jgi:hypothetical protein